MPLVCFLDGCRLSQVDSFHHSCGPSVFPGSSWSPSLSLLEVFQHQDCHTHLKSLLPLASLEQRDRKGGCSWSAPTSLSPRWEPLVFTQRGAAQLCFGLDCLRQDECGRNSLSPCTISACRSPTVVGQTVQASLS